MGAVQVGVGLRKADQQLRDCKVRHHNFGGHMYYNDPSRGLQAPSGGAELLRHTEDEPKSSFDSMPGAAQSRSERDTQRVMDALMREYWRRGPPLR
jgi:hypothetical protein